ncbi:MAG TPA: hypothetical protein VNZ22_08755 [Bacillota bacterium]|nr:hypothetical protein [Bacillota bacterium]
MTPKLIFLVVLSVFLSFAAASMLLRHQYTDELYVIGCGAFIGWSAVACRGRLPAWMKEHWGIVDDSAPGNLPVRIWLPVLTTAIVVAVLLFLYVTRF